MGRHMQRWSFPLPRQSGSAVGGGVGVGFCEIRQTSYCPALSRPRPQSRWGEGRSVMRSGWHLVMNSVPYHRLSRCSPVGGAATATRLNNNSDCISTYLPYASRFHIVFIFKTIPCGGTIIIIIIISAFLGEKLSFIGLAGEGHVTKNSTSISQAPVPFFTL